MTPDQIGEYLEHQGASDEEIDEFLEHVGVKGMKWGVRRQNRAANLRLVGSGKGNLGNKVRAYTSVGLIDIAKGRGLRGAAKRKGERVTKRNERVQKGKASFIDLIKYHGSIRPADLIPSRRSPNSTKASIGAAVAGGLIATIGYNALVKVANS